MAHATNSSLPHGWWITPALVVSGAVWLGIAWFMLGFMECAQGLGAGL